MTKLGQLCALGRFFSYRLWQNYSRNLLINAHSTSWLRSMSTLSPPKVSGSQVSNNTGEPTRTSTPRTLQAEEGLDPPIQYTTSEASTWLATETLFLKPREEVPPFQPLIVVVSFACLLLWFGVFREENDIDEEMKKPLWERVPGLEKTQLTMLISHNRGQGLPTADLEARLAEINAKEQQRMK